MKPHRFVPVLLVVLAALASSVTSASARNLSLSNQHIRITFSTVTFGAVTVRCRVTLEGSLHARTHAKVGGLLIGYITRGDIARQCTEPFGVASLAWFLTLAEGLGVETLPWHLRYQGFAGTLPNITTVSWQIVGMAWRAQDSTASCLSITTTAQPAFLDLEVGPGGPIVRARFNEAHRIRSSCGTEFALFSDGGEMTVLENSSVKITVTLI